MTAVSGSVLRSFFMATTAVRTQAKTAATPTGSASEVSAAKSPAAIQCRRCKASSVRQAKVMMSPSL